MFVKLLKAMISLLGTSLEKAGGEEFKEEVKKLSESHGPLELACGKAMLTLLIVRLEPEA